MSDELKKTQHSEFSIHNSPPTAGEFILYTTEDGQSRVECRFENETIWLSQALLAELFDRDVRTINEHLKNLYAEEELNPEATIRKFRIVRQEGEREVTREIEHYNLEAILAVGFRVKSPRGTQFRKWANTRLQEYLVKGFAIDDEVLLKQAAVTGEKSWVSVILVEAFTSTARPHLGH